MALDEVADDGRELARLQVKPLVGERREAQEVLVEPRVRVLEAGIEPAVGPRLHERIEASPMNASRKSVSRGWMKTPPSSSKMRAGGSWSM
jgi:hypothetical protein